MKIVTLAFWAVLLSVATSPSFAGDLTFTTIDVAPWASLDPATQQPVGFFPAVIHEIERRTGRKIIMELHPFVRIDHDMEVGGQDCTIILWNHHRAPYVEKGALVATHTMGVIARKGIRLKTSDDLRPLTISVLRGLQLDLPFDADPSLKKEFTTDYVIGLREIVYNRLDAILGALATIRYLARREGEESYLGDELVLGRIPLRLQCSKKSKNLHLMPDLNKAINEMRKDGTIDRLKKANSFL